MLQHIRHLGVLADGPVLLDQSRTDRKRWTGYDPGAALQEPSTCSSRVSHASGRHGVPLGAQARLCWRACCVDIAPVRTAAVRYCHEGPGYASQKVLNQDNLLFTEPYASYGLLLDSSDFRNRNAAHDYNQTVLHCNTVHCPKTKRCHRFSQPGAVHVPGIGILAFCTDRVPGMRVQV